MASHCFSYFGYGSVASRARPVEDLPLNDEVETEPDRKSHCRSSPVLKPSLRQRE